MKIIRLMAENVKKLKVVEITPTGAVVEITGPNNSGKSSVLDAIFWALAGTKDLPSQPVRRGEERAVIRLELGEITVIRRFTATGGTSLVVEAASGARFPSPQAMLDGLLGRLAFDPLAFSRMEPRQQLEALRKVVKLDRDLDKLDAETEAEFTKRTGLNREVKSLEARLAALPVFPDSTPDDPIPVDALIEKLNVAGRINMTIESRRRDLADLEVARVARLDAAAGRRAEASLVWQGAEREARALLDRANARRVELLQQAEALEAQAAEAAIVIHDVPTLPAVVNTEDIKNEIIAAQKVNSAVTVKRQAREMMAELIELKTQVVNAAWRIAENTKLREVTIAAAPKPLPGLAFGNGEVLYDGLPLNQAGDAEQLRISVAIAMAANPQLRIIRIKDGSLLDEAGLGILREMANVNDYQVWIERVDTTGRVGIVMEDGTAHAV